MPRKQNASQSRLGPFTIIYRNRWQDRSYTQGLTWDEKAMLAQLQTFDGISAAGVVRAEAPILAQQHPDRTGEQIEQYLTGLVSKGLILRSGSETFLRDWFLRQPAQLRAPKNVMAMLQAIRRIGYDDLRHEVVRELFAALGEIERVDGKATTADIRRLVTDFGQTEGFMVPDRLAI